MLYVLLFTILKHFINNVRMIWSGHSAECCDQEAESAVPKCDTCKAGVQRVQADEASQPQEHHRPAQLLHAPEVP